MSFKKILKILLVLEGTLFVVPWLSLFPVINTFFPEGFYQYGWIYSVFGIIALAPTLLVYVIVNHFESKNAHKTEQVNNSNVTDSTFEIDRVLWVMATGLFLFWAFSILFG